MQKQHFSAKTPAKINLSLAITGKRDNLHTLDMIVYPLDLFFDEVIFVPDENIGISKIRILSGFKGLKKRKFAKAIGAPLQKIANKLGVGGKIYIDKNIPLGAGLGGSSATIVSAVKAMQAYCASIGKDCSLDNNFLLELGSDVPCMYMGGVCRVQGVGEKVTQLACGTQLSFDIIVAKGGSNSGDCYKLFDELQKQDISLDDDDIATADSSAPCDIPQSVEEAISDNRNDLTKSALILNPNIEKAMHILSTKNNAPVYMSGSGSTVFCVHIDK